MLKKLSWILLFATVAATLPKQCEEEKIPKPKPGPAPVEVQDSAAMPQISDSLDLSDEGIEAPAEELANLDASMTAPGLVIGKEEAAEESLPAAKPAPKPVQKPAPRPVQKPAPKPVQQTTPAPKPEEKPAVKPAAEPQEAPKPAPKPAEPEDFTAPVFEMPYVSDEYTGGVKGRIVNRVSRQGIEKAKLTFWRGAREVTSFITGPDGSFLVEKLADGMYSLNIAAPDFLDAQVEFMVDGGHIKNVFNISLTPTGRIADLDDDAFAQFDMDDSGYNDNPTILFGSNDVFNNIAGYNFSAVRFRARGYSSESQEVYLAGVKMNDAITGYSPFSLWSGLNEAMRSKDTSNGLESLDVSLGGYNGVTNIYSNASSVRTGKRGSVMTNSSLYRLRLMGSYATGMMDNGWAFAVNVSARLGGNDWIDGVYYKSLAYYLGADKQIDDHRKVSFVLFGTPGERGAQNASTQEVYDLVGDNMYNSNWGYQGGKVRNARVRKTHEPVALVKYDFTPNDDFSASATVLYRFGKNGYTALDWYDAQDPRPDYYRNLPSYFYGTDEYGQYLPDLNRNNYTKYMWSKEIWTHSSDYSNLTHINWDRIYNVNRLQGTGAGDARSKYVQEERHVDQRDFNLAGSFKWRPASWAIVTGGADAKINRTEYYKKIADLLGGDFFVDVDSFAERDFGSSEAKIQNDLDYYNKNGAARILHVGDKYGYDYYAQVRNASVWVNGCFSKDQLNINVGARLGTSTFWREGLVRKGLFAGLDDAGNEMYDAAGNKLTTYDHNGKVVSSLGRSEKRTFATYAFKAGATYVLSGNQRVYGNIGLFQDAPTFNQSFLSPRTRNSIVDNLTPIHTFSTDVNWQYTGNGINARLTAYYTTIKDQSKVMSAYDDIQNAFSNFAISGIDQRNYGIEFGFKAPTPVPSLFLQGVISAGRYEFTSNPTLTQTVDNSSEVVMENVLVPYWMSSPVLDSNGKVVRYQRHFIPSVPQFASSLGVSYNYNYWFIEGDIEYFANAYLDMNPLYRTDYATAGTDNYVTPVEVAYMTRQERFKPCWLVNASVGKSWYIQRKYQVGMSFNVKNLLNNKDVKTGGYEQTRIVDNTVSKERFYRFDPKYFYMAGLNYMLNIYFRF